MVRIGELLGYKPDKSVKLFKKAQQALLGDAEKRGREAASGFAKFRRKDVEVLSLLISAAMADDRVKPEEEVWVHGFGKWLGFTKEEVQDILDESIQAKIRMTSR